MDNTYTWHLHLSLSLSLSLHFLTKTRVSHHYTLNHQPSTINLLNPYPPTSLPAVLIIFLPTAHKIIINKKIRELKLPYQLSSPWKPYTKICEFIAQFPSLFPVNCLLIKVFAVFSWTLLLVFIVLRL